MNKKKLLSAALSCALVLSMSVPAFAASSSANVTTPNSDGIYSMDVAVSGSTEAPAVKITVPTTGAVVVNPYKMEVADPANNSGPKLKDQVISAPLVIKNESNVAINVGVTVTGEVAGNALFATATTALKSPLTNSVFMYLEIVEATGTAGATRTFASAYDPKATNMVLVGAKATTKAGVHTMKAGDTTATYAAFRLAGDVASAPTKAWTSADKVSAKMVFTFAPAIATTP